MIKAQARLRLRVPRFNGRGRLPELAPPETPQTSSLSRVLSRTGISLSHTSAMPDVLEPVLRAEHQDVVARLTVYVVNLIVITFAAPLGMVLLLFNILGGENLRTSAHALALTGTFLALAEAGAFA